VRGRESKKYWKSIKERKREGKNVRERGKDIGRGMRKKERKKEFEGEVERYRMSRQQPETRLAP